MRLRVPHERRREAELAHGGVAGRADSGSCSAAVASSTTAHAVAGSV